MATVVIDAGHGGYDNGATYLGRLEKDDNLKLALAVGNILKSRGINVVYTRDSDVFIPLLERSYISNRNNADLFISLHRNASVDNAAHGVENFVFTTPSAQSITNAENVLNRVVDVGVQRNRGLKRENFSVLRYTAAPAQLLELGFITNAVDNALFDLNFNAYAQAIANGILDSLGQPGTATGDATIKSIQQTLNSRYNAGLAVDGFWGPMSNRALIRGFQIELNNQYGANLVTDGIWGPQTKAATPLLRNGARGNLVYLLQAALFINNNKLTLDSAFGPETERAVRNFQLANGLVADGIAGPNTFERLFARF